MSQPTGQRPNETPQSGRHKEPEMAPEQGLIRELWALLLVYGALIIVPLLTGIACES